MKRKNLAECNGRSIYVKEQRFCLSCSDVLQQVGLLRVAQPGGGPAGFDAGPRLQTVVVSCQFGIALLAQSARLGQKKKVGTGQTFALVQLICDPLTRNGRDRRCWGKDRRRPW